MADDDVLSDDEIEALLDEEGGDESGGGGGGDDLDEVRSVYEEVAETVENILTTVLGRDVTSQVIECAILEKSELDGALEGENWVVVNSDLSGAVEGTARYVLPEEVALRLAHVMMGEEDEEPPDEFDDAYQSAVVEIYNQLVNSLATTLNDLTGEEIELQPPESSVISTDELLDRVDDEEFLWVEYAFSVEDLFDSGTFFELQPSAIADLIQSTAEEEEPEPEPEPETKPDSQSAPSGGDGGGSEAAESDQKDVKSVDFPQFEASEGDKPAGDINMLMDVPMEVSVELGRTNLQVKEILNLGAGSIIELDRLAGEPVDLLINGRLVARGEVVVIDENFGVRVTAIVSPMERIKQ